MRNGLPVLEAQPSPAQRSYTNVVLASTDTGAHICRSGYPVISDYLPGTTYISRRRTDPHGLPSRLVAGVVRRLALSRWYQPGSARMEFAALRALQGRPAPQLLHLLWADHDCGFIDLLRRVMPFQLCGTFHMCPDDLERNLPFGTRLSRFDAIVLMSEVQRAFFQKNGVPDSKVHVVHHGVDTRHFRPGESRADRFTVIFVGKTRRNVELLREVCDALAHRSDIHFVIVAPPSYAPVFADRPNVKVRSGLSDVELLEAYQSASCFLLTAEQATANNALVEALACGLPVVAERVGGIPEYVTDACAFLTEPGRSAPIVEAILHLSQTERVRNQMGVEAREQALRLDWTIVANKTMQLYDALLSKN